MIDDWDILLLALGFVTGIVVLFYFEQRVPCVPAKVLPFERPKQ